MQSIKPTSDPESLPKYEPTSRKAVLDVKDLLFKKLPLEIVDIVIEYAEYWPCTTVTTGGRTTEVGYNGDVFIVSLTMFHFAILPVP